MSRVAPFCALTLLCASFIVGCGKKDDSESGGSGGGARPDGQPMLRSRTADDKKDAVARLKQLGVAMHNSEATYGVFPAGIVGQKGQLGLSWRVTLLPFIEQEALYKQFKLDEPWDSEHNKKLIPKMPQVFEAPGTIVSNGKTFLRSFSGPSAFIPVAPPGPKGAPVFNAWSNLPPGSPARGRNFASIPDGTSNTLMVVEAAEAVEWTKPEELTFNDVPGGPTGPLPKFGGLFDGGFHGLMCDGSVRFFPDTLGEKNLRALITVNGAEVHSPDVTDILFSPKAGGPKSNPPDGDDYVDVFDGKGKLIGKKKTFK